MKIYIEVNSFLYRVKLSVEMSGLQNISAEDAAAAVRKILSALANATSLKQILAYSFSEVVRCCGIWLEKALFKDYEEQWSAYLDLALYLALGLLSRECYYTPKYGAEGITALFRGSTDRLVYRGRVDWEWYASAGRSSAPLITSREDEARRTNAAQAQCEKQQPEWTRIIKALFDPSDLSKILYSTDTLQKTIKALENEELPPGSALHWRAEQCWWLRLCRVGKKRVMGFSEWQVETIEWEEKALKAALRLPDD
ncbi:hypothetical protein BP00DRAFT_412091 [Aspergillus indologenus CBS 114.80]|uniref:Uncharacterized protein n=1 Tax=Aspergillus indologenus CBS 114.80 TaxID=1450541 RepID=A0A2V5IN08_9EURO|nr:hypothetical protein BP00DRAFT_412091 [Aspergillus indologenus CBS 114.80]